MTKNEIALRINKIAAISIKIELTTKYLILLQTLIFSCNMKLACLMQYLLKVMYIVNSYNKIA